ncbi:MAG: flagellin [Thermoplasmata archaeon]|nr:MAG: flagellin [Thermoplasmata archaeon]
MKCKVCIQNRDAAIGLGAMIIFIAMVLVAGIAASVIIQTSSNLEMQVLRSGQETTTEVSTGIRIEGVEGLHQSSKITKLAIELTTRAGSSDIDLNTTIIEISDSSSKFILKFGGSSQHCNSSDINGDILNNGKFGSSTTFGINVLHDADGSCTSSTPIINFGDHVFLGINTASVFSSSSGLNPRIDIFGLVISEDGAPGIIGFSTPAAYSSAIIELQ